MCPQWCQRTPTRPLHCRTCAPRFDQRLIQLIVGPRDYIHGAGRGRVVIEPIQPVLKLTEPKAYCLMHILQLLVLLHLFKPLDLFICRKHPKMGHSEKGVSVWPASTAHRLRTKRHSARPCLPAHWCLFPIIHPIHFSSFTNG